jgi:hypothetical protein
MRSSKPIDRHCSNHNHHLNKGNEIRKIRPEKQKKQLKTMLSQLYYLPCLITIYGSKKPLQIHVLPIELCDKNCIGGVLVSVLA